MHSWLTVGGIAPNCAAKAREPICGGKCHRVTLPSISASFSVWLVTCGALQLWNSRVCICCTAFYFFQSECCHPPPPPPLLSQDPSSCLLFCLSDHSPLKHSLFSALCAAQQFSRRYSHSLASFHFCPGITQPQLNHRSILPPFFKSANGPLFLLIAQRLTKPNWGTLHQEDGVIWTPTPLPSCVTKTVSSLRSPVCTPTRASPSGLRVATRSQNQTVSVCSGCSEMFYTAAACVELPR